MGLPAPAEWDAAHGRRHLPLFQDPRMVRLGHRYLTGSKDRLQAKLKLTGLPISPWQSPAPVIAGGLVERLRLEQGVVPGTGPSNRRPKVLTLKTFSAIITLCLAAGVCTAWLAQNIPTAQECANMAGPYC